MSFASYAALQTAIADQMARDDLTTQIVDFITLFEAYSARRLQVREQETSTTLTTSSGSVSLPTDYMVTRRLTYAGSVRRDLEYMHPAQLQAQYPSTPNGIPINYTIEGGTIKVRPIDDSNSYEFDYFAKNTAVSSALNWLFNNYPDAYFSGSLFEAYSYDKDVNNATYWKARRDEIFQEIELRDFRSRGPMSIDIAGGITP